MIKTDIEEMINYQTLGAIIRSKTKWYEEGEKIQNISSIWRKEIMIKVVKRLCLQNGTLITDREEISFEQ